MEVHVVDTTFFRPAEHRIRDAMTFQIVMIAPLIWQSGYEYAVEAVHRLRVRGVDATLCIVGDGPEQLRLLYTIDDLMLNDVVQVVGRLSPEEMRHHLQHADVFLCTGLCGAVTPAVCEAMACGLPVVTMDSEGMRGMIADGVEGCIVPIRDAETIAEVLERLANLPSMRARMGHAARQRIVEAMRLD